MIETHVRRLSEHIRTPQSEGYRASQKYLRDQITTLGCTSLEQRFETWGFGTCMNIYCEIGDPNHPRILLGAHYESREESGFAADDNASACAVLLALIPHLQAIKNLSFTVIFFDMEEHHGWGSLRGSRAFARWYNRPLSRVIILDTVGGTLVPGFENTFLQFGSAFPRLSTSDAEFLHLPMKVLEPLGSMGARSDYDEFRKKGVPFAFISAGTPWYYHTPHDTIDKVSFHKLDKLRETLVALLKGEPQLRQGTDGQSDDLIRFVQKLSDVPELRTPRICKYRDAKKDLSRLQIVLLYKDVLGIIRKRGAQIFDKKIA